MQRIVIKLGTQVVVDEDGPATKRLQKIVDDIANLVRQGSKVVLVSSGAIGLGKKKLGLNGALELPEKQACAAVGQPKIMELYEQLFGAHNITVAQILVTAHDFSDREKYLNLKNSFEQLLDLGVVPVVNENDVVSISGLKDKGVQDSFDDNDKLSALVAGKMGAELLVALTNVDGVYAENPATNPEAKLIRKIPSLADLQGINSVGQSPLGRGGMTSKLSAARIASICGVKTIIASGLADAPISRAISGESGTTIIPQEALSGRKRWIGLSSGYSGIIQINKCAVDILLTSSVSLLPVGVVAVIGEFDLQDVISVQDEQGQEIGRGLASMSAETLRQVKGMHTKDAHQHLRVGEKDEVIHCDNLVVFES